MGVGGLGKLFWSLLRKLKPTGLSDLGRFLMTSPRSWLDNTFENGKVKAMLAAWGMHLDFAPDTAGGALFPYLEGMANQAFGMALGKGGAQCLTDSLVALIERKGGQVICNSKVVEILTEKGRARSIVLESGEEVQAKKAIICLLYTSPSPRD